MKLVHKLDMSTARRHLKSPQSLTFLCQCRGRHACCSIHARTVPVPQGAIVRACEQVVRMGRMETNLPHWKTQEKRPISPTVFEPIIHSNTSNCTHIVLDCFTSHVGEHRTVHGLWKRQGIPCFCKIPTVQQSPEKEMPFVYVTLVTDVTLATAQYSPCLFEYVTIGLGRHNQTPVSQSERLLLKPQRPCTDLCAESVGVWNRLTLSELTTTQWSWF